MYYILHAVQYHEEFLLVDGTTAEIPVVETIRFETMRELGEAMWHGIHEKSWIEVVHEDD